MANIRLLALDQIAWIQVAEDPAVFAVEQRLVLGVEPDFLRSVGQQTVALLQRTSATPPWTGYLAVDCSREIIIGTCSFTAPPDAEGIVEIAYFTFPPFEGRGYATAMAAALVELAEGATAIRKVRAHTLPERNASTRVLQKLGFDWIGEAVDPEVGRVWRWERDCHLPWTCR
jgi:RimJ/RimL family protein N-acetyltransferase